MPIRFVKHTTRHLCEFNLCSWRECFLSVDAADEIQDMPTLYDVPTDLEVLNASSADALVANDWDDLLDGEIASSFDFDWWSGSDPAGAILSLATVAAGRLRSLIWPLVVNRRLRIHFGLS